MAAFTVIVILDTLLMLMERPAQVNHSYTKTLQQALLFHHLADPCAYQLVAPQDGSIICTGVSTDDNCNFTCDPGFSLFGESIITCLPNHQWSAQQPSCTRLACDGFPVPPDYGHVVQPCSDAFGQTCYIACNTGYQLERGTTNRSCIAHESAPTDVFWTTDITTYCGGNQTACNIS